MTVSELFEQIRRKQSFLCVGLDTDIRKIPQHLLSCDDPVFSFNRQIIDATAAYAVCYKPNLAFYEENGRAGWESLEKTIRYIRENYTTVTLTSVAKHFGKSEGYLSRYIRRETGKTFRFLLKEFRMKQAANMIENSTCNMEEVAEAIGYSDISCFYRNFKESFGCTPQQYRNKRNRVSL